MITSARLQALRAALRVSQDGLADLLYMTGPNRARTVRRWETEGNIPGPTQRALEAIAKDNGILLEDLPE